VIEHNDIIKVFNKVRDLVPKSLKEQILLLDIYILQYNLVSDIQHLQNLRDTILKLIKEILPDVDIEDWLIKLLREDPISANKLQHAMIATLRIEEFPFLKRIPDVLFNHVYEEESPSPGSSIILYQALEKTKEEKYRIQLLENLNNVTGIEKIKCLTICYLITRDEAILTQAYELIIPKENLSKGDSLDYYIWEVSDFQPDQYPNTPEFRRFCKAKVDLLLENEVSDFETIHLALAYVLGETKIWDEEIFNTFTPHIKEHLKLLVDNETGAVVIGRSEGLHRKIGLKGTLNIGKISERPAHGLGHYGRTLLLDCTQPHVIFISGHRGSGKSYTMGVIAEELATAQIGIGVIILDPLGVYWSMKYANWEEKERKILEKWNLEPKSFQENVKVFVPLGHFNLTPKETKDESFSIRPSELSVDDWCYVFDVSRFSPRGILIEKTIKLVQEGFQAELKDSIVKVKGKGDKYSLEDIIRCMNTSTFVTDKDKGFTRQTRRAMVSRFEIAKEWGIFSDEGTPLIELSRPNQISIVDVSVLDQNLHALITGILARKVLRARLQISRQVEAAKISIDEGEAIESIPITWILIDEAHLLAPARGNTAASEPLVQYAKLGRKPGCGLVLCTQQPSATNVQILSQLDKSFCHFLTYSSDIDSFVHRAPGNVPHEVNDAAFFRSLPVGVCVIADESITTNRIFVARIRPRISQHAGRESLPKIIDQMDRPIIIRPDVPEIPDLSSLTPSSPEKPSDETTFITLPPSSPSSPLQDDMKVQDLSESKTPFFEINLPKNQLEDYMKRLLLYKYRKHLYPVGSSNLHEKIFIKTLSETPSLIITHIQDALLQKGWVIDKIISDTDLPVFLISKEGFKIAFSIAKIIESTQSLIVFVVTTPKQPDIQQIEALFNSLTTQLK